MNKKAELRRIEIERAREQLKDRRFEAELRRIEIEASIANARERTKLPRANRHLCTVIGVADFTKLPRANRHLWTVIGLADFIARDSKELVEGDAGELGFVKVLSFKYARAIADLLILMAYANPGKLRDLGEAICLGLRDGGIDSGTDRPIALELVNAYEQCTAFPPTVPEVREVFKARKKSGTHEFRWPGDRYARRLLDSLSLQRGPAKRGAPRGPRRKDQN